MPVPFDRDHDDAHDSRNGSAVGASPGASSFGASAPEVAANEVEQTDAASTAGGDATVTEKTWLQKLNWISAAKWFAVALFLFGWMASELNKPTNPATPGPKVGFRALIVYVNMLVGLRAGGVLLALAMFAALGTGIWVLIKKPKEAATA